MNAVLDDDPTRPVLELDAARLPLPEETGGVLRVDIAVHAGDLVIIDPRDEAHERAIADVACGLLAPQSGAVRFLGRDWSAMPPDHANAMRGRIGHIFRTGEWIPYLSVENNVLLAQLHHTGRPLAEVRNRAARLALHFGLPGLPVQLPHELSAGDLQRIALVRAFLGEPALIIIESPARGLMPELATPMINAVRAARDRDAAVVWFMHETRLWFERSLPASARYGIRGHTIVPVEA